MTRVPRHDVLVAGSGFAGSLTAMALAHHGLSVLVVEAGRHPRFAIGESSTPAADMILRDLASEHGMPWLADFSRYGSWVRNHPQVGCGLKRGFSYFFHRPGEAFSEGEGHEHSLMVAASTSDENSDTQWLREDFDAFLVERLTDSGIAYRDMTRVMAAVREGSGEWRVALQGEEGPAEVGVRFIIDATGPSGIAESVLGARRIRTGFRTRSAAIFSHFAGVSHWSEALETASLPTGDHPYDPDHSALHHLVEEGWFWMLRFRTDEGPGRLSAGLVVDGRGAGEGARDLSPDDFERVLRRYPSLAALFRGARIHEPPGAMQGTGRLQSRLEPGAGEGWLALGGAAGFIDPLHSTGIAQTLCGIERVVRVVADGGLDGLRGACGALGERTRRELRMIDALVAVSYDSRFDPELFHACTMLYFACTVAWEVRRLRGDDPSHFLLAGDPALAGVVEGFADRIRRWREGGARRSEVPGLVDGIREAIRPWNTAGLLDPERRRMYRHTAVEL